MSLRPAAAAILLLAGLAILHRPSLRAAAPRLLVNETPSVPRGLYLRSADAAPRLGRLVTTPQPATARAYLASLQVPPEMRLLKRVAAVPGETVCAGQGRLSTPRAQVAVPDRDRRGTPLPTWRGCRRLAADEVLLLGDTATSFDSRYFGPVRRPQIEAAYQQVLGW